MSAAPSAELQLDLREIKPGDKVTGFSVGAEFQPLKTFLKRDALEYHSKDLGKTYAFFEQVATPRIRAYITLVCGEIVVDENLPEVDADFRYPSFPAVKIARLAVETEIRGRDLGTSLVRWALGIVKEHICPRVGCRFVVVDAKQASVAFYRKQGFTMLDTATNKARDEPIMFIDLCKVDVA